MKFRSYNYHKSSTIEKWASNLSAIEFIVGFRKRNKVVFNVLATLLVGGVLALLLAFIGTFYPRFFSPLFIISAASFGALMVLICKPRRGNKRKIKIAVMSAIVIYLAVILGGTLKVQGQYDSLQQRIAATGLPVQYIEKSFWGHVEAVSAQPAKAWHYVWSDEELIYTELVTEYGQAAGMDTNEVDFYLGM